MGFDGDLVLPSRGSFFVGALFIFVGVVLPLTLAVERVFLGSEGAPVNGERNA